MFGSVLAPFINFRSQHIYTARAPFIPTLFYVFFTLSTSRLYQIELVHQVETLKRIYVLETKDLVSLLFRGECQPTGSHPTPSEVVKNARVKIA